MTTEELLDSLAARRASSPHPIDTMFVDWVTHWVKVDAGLEHDPPFDYSI